MEHTGTPSWWKIFPGILAAIAAVMAVAFLARVATGTFGWAEIFAGKSHRAGTIVEQSGALTIARGEHGILRLAIRNDGPDPWTSHGSRAVWLQADNLLSDSFYVPDSTWLSGNKIELWEDEVPVGEIGHFRFPVETDLETGDYLARFEVVDANLNPLTGLDRVVWPITIEAPRWGFEPETETQEVDFHRGEHGVIQISYRNTGNTIWKNFGEHPVALKLVDENDAAPFFVENHWPDETHAAWLDQPAVLPGERGTFTAEITIPGKINSATLTSAPEVIGIDAGAIAPTVVKAKFNTGPSTTRQLTFAASGELTPSNPNELKLTAVAAEHGDSYIVITPAGEVIVFDTAHPSRANVVLDALRRLGVAKIDYFFLSHPHWDHIGGAPVILEDYPVDHIPINGEGYPYETYARLAETLKGVSDRVELVAAGETFSLTGGVEIKIFNPSETLTGVSDNDEAVNNNSLVAKITWDGRSILLPADIYTATIEQLLDTGLDLQADVLALPHHGNDGWGGIEGSFLDAVNPKVVIKSASWTEWQEMTSSELQQALANEQIRLVSTARDGEINLSLEDSGIIYLETGITAEKL